MQIGRIDGMLDFGSVALATGTEFPNTLQLNKADPKLMRVVATATGAEGGTSFKITLKGSNDNSAWTTVAESQAAAETAEVQFPESGPHYDFYKVTISKTGSYTAGTIHAAVDTFMGV